MDERSKTLAELSGDTRAKTRSTVILVRMTALIDNSATILASLSSELRSSSWNVDSSGAVNC
jgi:hypothetical protein